MRLRRFFRRIGMALKNADYRHYICAAITVALLCVSGFCFTNSYIRFGEACRDICTSVSYYFNTLLDKPVSAPTVNDWSAVPLQLPFNLPTTWEDFKVSWGNYWTTWATWNNFVGYCRWLGTALYLLCEILLIAMPFVLVFVFVAKIMSGNTNNDYNRDSRPLVGWKKLCARLYAPVKRWVLSFVQFIQYYSAYWKIWLCIWLFNFNVATIILEFIAFYLYFVSSFDVLFLYRQVCKLLLDLSTAINTIPLAGWLLVAWLVFNKIRRNIGYSILTHHEMRNRGLINERAICLMLVGTMGTGKTTIITDMGLSQEIMFRDKAFEKLLQHDLKFPYFPWINFENAIKHAMDTHYVYNLASCRRFVLRCKRAWRKGVRKGKNNGLFGYDWQRYGLTYNNGLEVQDIWKVLENYCQLYFIYVIECSLIIANYGVRSDTILQDLGNFPLWNTELFRRDSRLMDAYSRHAHILDFDALRLGKKVVENNKYANYFEFGVVLITEIGKERGNALENKGKKKTDEEANQFNDLFNSCLKMIRHSATVDGFPFVRIISDEQRADSLGADARELCEIVNIKETGETKLAMPFFNLGDLIFGWIHSKFTARYTDYRYRRGDNTLLMYWYKSIMHKINAYRERIYNTFGYCASILQIERGTRDSDIVEKKYYRSDKKIKSKRFATDAYSAFFANKALQSLVGLEDVPCYGAVKATVQEFCRQNSYFMADLLVNLFRQQAQLGEK